jgi:hemerythrin-like domain-containing protein
MTSEHNELRAELKEVRAEIKAVARQVHELSDRVARIEGMLIGLKDHIRLVNQSR